MSSRYEFTTFSITGIPSVGNTLSITEDTPDPDGTRTLSYSWQSSSDNSTWSQVSTSSTYTLTSAEEGKYIKAVISYTDAEGHSSSVTTPEASTANERNCPAAQDPVFPSSRTS